MLDRLDQVNWEHIGFHVYPRPEKIPGAVHTLLSQDPEERAEALGFLFGSGQDSGDIYDTTPHILPFIMELLADPVMLGKEEVLVHLAAVAESIHRSQRLSVHMMRLCLSTYDAFKAGMDTVLLFFRGSSFEVRLAATQLLQHLTDEIEVLVPEFMDRISADGEEEMKVACLFGLKTLLASMEWPRYGLRERYAPFFNDLVDSHPSARIRAAAARASVELLDRFVDPLRRISSRVVQVLSEEFLARSHDLRYDTAAGIYHEANEIARDLARLGSAPLLNLLKDRELTGDQAHLVARAALSAELGSAEDIRRHWEAYADVTRLGEGVFYIHSYWGTPWMISGHRAALEIIVGEDRVWERPTNLLSFFWGLPDDRETLRAIVARPGPADRL